MDSFYAQTKNVAAVPIGGGGKGPRTTQTYELECFEKMPEREMLHELTQGIGA